MTIRILWTGLFFAATLGTARAVEQCPSEVQVSSAVCQVDMPNPFCRPRCATKASGEAPPPASPHPHSLGQVF